MDALAMDILNGQKTLQSIQFITFLKIFYNL